MTIILLQGVTGFRLACENGHTEIINLLLSTADVDVDLQDDVSQQHTWDFIKSHYRT